MEEHHTVQAEKDFRNLNILFVSAEVSPFAKVGGLADVAGSLPKELVQNGNDVRIVMPLYRMVEDNPKIQLETVASAIPVRLSSEWIEVAHVKRARMDGVPVYFIGHDSFFTNATSSDKVYTPGIEQYLFLSAAVLALPRALAWHPDVIHCNDWHTGIIPVLMREKHEEEFEDTAAVFSIHNLAYQGEFGIDILDLLDLPRTLFVPELLETYGTVNFLKSGCVYSDRVNTVSEQYAREIQTPEFGCRLEGLMKWLAEHGRLSGILNGIGTHYFDPEIDPMLPANFCADDPSGKAVCRNALVEQLGLPSIPEAPLIGAVTRLSTQKGLDLLIAAAPDLFQIPVQLVVQGLGDTNLAAELRCLEAAYPDHIRFVEKFDEDIAQRIYGGADMFIMPSKFEPCGLGQMIALRYGTIPIVRATGGLADTVHEGDNGFVFTDPTSTELIAAVRRATTAFQKKSWPSKVRQAMRGDYSWSRSAKAYEELYRDAADSRKERSAVAV